MLKYMLTTKCNRRCSYCITKNVRGVDEVVDYFKILEALKPLAKEHRTIMLTGGEPTLAPQFNAAAAVCDQLFGEVHMTSQNPMVFKHGGFRWLKSLTFSLHDLRLVPDPKGIGVPVYASILADQFVEGLPEYLAYMDYRGLTINDDQFGDKEFNENRLTQNPLINDWWFSIKINRVGHCLDETIILPDLSVIDDFTPFLKWRP